MKFVFAAIIALVSSTQISADPEKEIRDKNAAAIADAAVAVSETKLSAADQKKADAAIDKAARAKQDVDEAAMIEGFKAEKAAKLSAAADKAKDAADNKKYADEANKSLNGKNLSGPSEAERWTAAMPEPLVDGTNPGGRMGPLKWHN